MPCDQRAYVADVRVQVLAVNRPDLDVVVLDERRRDVVLGRERVGRAQRGARAAGDQSLHQVGGLGGDVQACGHPHALERALGGEALAHLPEHGHLIRRPRDPRRALGGEAGIGNVISRPRMRGRAGPRMRGPGLGRMRPSHQYR